MPRPLPRTVAPPGRSTAEAEHPRSPRELVQRITGNRSVAWQRRPGRGGTLIAMATYAIGPAGFGRIIINQEVAKQPKRAREGSRHVPGRAPGMTCACQTTPRRLVPLSIESSRDQKHEHMKELP